MKSLSVRPCSTAPRQKAAHWAASVQKVGMVKDWPELERRSTPSKPALQRRSTRVNALACPPQSPSGRFPDGSQPGTYMRQTIRATAAIAIASRSAGELAADSHRQPGGDDLDDERIVPMILETRPQMVSLAGAAFADGARASDRLVFSP